MNDTMPLHRPARMASRAAAHAPEGRSAGLQPDVSRISSPPWRLGSTAVAQVGNLLCGLRYVARVRDAARQAPWQPGPLARSFVLLLHVFASLRLCVPACAAESPTVIPFQGRITDQSGNTYTSGQYTILFQFYNQAVGGQAVWQERHDKVGVVNGLVNVFLGSINTLTSVDFSTTKHLGITIDADSNPNTPEPEMVPRQMIIPAFWAKTAETTRLAQTAVTAQNATALNGFDWTWLLADGAQSPQNGFLSPKLIKPTSITSQQIAPNSISQTNLSPRSIVGRESESDNVWYDAGAGDVFRELFFCDPWPTFTDWRGVRNFLVTTTSLNRTSDSNGAFISTGRPLLVNMQFTSGKVYLEAGGNTNNEPEGASMTLQCLFLRADSGAVVPTNDPSFGEAIRTRGAALSTTRPGVYWFFRAGLDPGRYRLRVSVTQGATHGIVDVGFGPDTRSSTIRVRVFEL